ncbi:hypothetical protein PFICI_09854 [Pestalotiopsis fici W106-1]|uniref:PLD phosphodiesterase domain-containing protein n=1 Tax=Pestalotiopsis fici (strain W106-1 / CGMCC3.15140) TaxID=1229662 RepID=W3WXF6_PESFW|nr:uncharacterized protein PFICI_09854 [Pestalotiopsis fici W106-1]ETS77792.1 hypothetical protein PFICI_09854 [Pestalotiopsis fici W106-1]
MSNLNRLLSDPRAGFDKLTEEERIAREADISTDSGSEGASSTDSDDETGQPAQDTTKSKRKASQELVNASTKATKHSSTGKEPSTSNLKFPNGALRITRTEGRKKAKNCVGLEDLVDKQSLVSACIYSYFIADGDLLKYLPLSKTSNDVPIYIGRDVGYDEHINGGAAAKAGLQIKGKATKKQLDVMESDIHRRYQDMYGKNYHAFNAWAPGSAHTKILLLVYRSFLRLVITSCNMMDSDTVHGDNHWYIHDIPRLTTRSQKMTATKFEQDLLSHLRSLRVPHTFIDSIEGQFDYSSVRVQLITSVPGTWSGAKAEQHGLLRLRNAVNTLGLGLPKKNSEGKLQIEVCAASIGKLNAKWLNGFHDCVLGKQDLTVAREDCQIPNLKIFYPTRGNFEDAHKSAQQGATNLGCHTKPWKSAHDDIKRLFHHYVSKDPGCLLHQKLIAVFNGRDRLKTLYFLYIGSANLSQSAWGALEDDKRGNDATSGTKLVKTTNLECGVLIPGRLIEDLLEPGTESWIEGVIPYEQNARQYDLLRDEPFTSDMWVREENWRDDY